MVKQELIDFIPMSPDRIGMKNLADALGETERDTRKRIAEARINGECVAKGTGSSKHRAEMDAAEKALKVLGISGE